jgi:hypothetical protein
MPETITDPSIHTCHADGCDKPVPERMFMCRPHWYTLPYPMRRSIWMNYRPGQEIDKQPSRRYLDVAHEAIVWLKRHEAAKKAKEITPSCLNP